MTCVRSSMSSSESSNCGSAKATALATRPDGQLSNGTCAIARPSGRRGGVQKGQNVGPELGQDVAQRGSSGRAVRAWTDRPQEPGLGQELQVVAHRGRWDVLAIHKRDITRRKRLVANCERAQRADPQGVS